MPLAKTLSALALLGAAVPSTYAVSIKDDTVKLGIGIRLQTRVTMADATGTDGEEYRVQTGTLDAVNDPLDFQIRRSRLYLKIGYGENWKGELAMNADNIDGSASGASRAVSVRYAWMERTFKSGDLKHAVQFGLFKPYNNPEAAMSSSRLLFPYGDAGDDLLAIRETGIEYRLHHPVFIVAAHIMNNDVVKDVDTAGDNADESEGFFYGARAEFSFSPEWFISKRAESFLGKEGKGLNVGLSYGVNSDARLEVDPGPVDVTRSTSAFSLDVMFWMNNISAFAEFRNQTVETEPTAGGSSTDVDSQVILAQVGYAFPLENGTIIEPALRFQIIDGNTDDDEEETNYGSGENGGSGTQIDIGVNYYLDGHDNKFQLAYSLWSAEDGDGDANILRLQHQLNF